MKGSCIKALSGTPGYSTYVAGCAKKGVSPQIPSILPNTDHAVPRTHWDASHPYYPRPEGLFIAESHRKDLWDPLPHVVARTYHIAIQNKVTKSGLLIYVHFPQDLYRVKVIRGAISSGSEWEFMIFQLNENGKGGVDTGWR